MELDGPGHECQLPGPSQRQCATRLMNYHAVRSLLRHLANQLLAGILHCLGGILGAILPASRPPGSVEWRPRQPLISGTVTSACPLPFGRRIRRIGSDVTSGLLSAVASAGRRLCFSRNISCASEDVMLLTNSRNLQFVAFQVFREHEVYAGGHRGASARSCSPSGCVPHPDPPCS